MVQRYKYIIGIIVVVLLGVTMIARTQKARIPKLEAGVNVHELENEIFAALGPESVAVTTNQSSGSGILWQYDGKEMLVITTNHLVQESESGELELWTGEKLAFFKENIYTSKEEDLAVIKVACEKKLNLKKGGVAEHLVQNVPEIGTSLWIIDSVYGAASGIGTCSVASDEIFLEDYSAEMLLLYGEGKIGMSGSPVYDMNGKLVGMMSGMSEDKTTLAAVSSGKIMRFMESLF